ncbi:MAG: FAD-dependent oxidoreductase [Proteobacteria bacterium]|nr:FAD-dependent oxidoreductase [Pseudomonadota bacterium]
MTPKKLVIVGGVAGGASCAARARRLNENVEIKIFERSAYISYANCGLPYHVGGVIRRQEELFLATADLFYDRFLVDVQTDCEAVAVDPVKKVLTVHDLNTGETLEETYDWLLLSPGAAPLVPPDLPGVNLPGLFTVRTVTDALAMNRWIADKEPQVAVVAGAGYIGLEMAENLARRGLTVHLVERENQIMPAVDPEMAVLVARRLKKKGIHLHLGSPVQGFSEKDGGLSVALPGQEIACQMVVLSLGVRPEIKLAVEAGIEIGERGGILVDDRMCTSAPDVFAVGDAVEVKGYVLGDQRYLPLATPANLQGRLVADVLFGSGQPEPRYRGSQASAVVGIFGLTLAMTGETEKSLAAARARGVEVEWEKVYLHPGHHAGYYPGAKDIALKILYSKKDGRILGAQAVGEAGVDKRMDVIAMAIQMDATVDDLAQAQLCYAPQYGSAKDAVNMAGMVAGNALHGLYDVVHWTDVPGSDALILDVRSEKEVKDYPVPGALFIHTDSVRAHLDELPRDREIWTFCLVGVRSYLVTRMLTQHGFASKTLSGGILTRQAFIEALGEEAVAIPGTL